MADNDFRSEQNMNNNDKTDKGNAQQNARRQSLDSGVIDRELDAALALYAAVEPRAGLEDRILANLRAERAHPPAHAWWRWTAAPALAAMLLVALTFFLRSGERRRDNVAGHPSPSHTAQDSVSNGTQVVANRASNPTRVPHPASEKKPRPRISDHRSAVMASGPKLDQFPSPQPLSEQEKILESYVARYPEHAALIAQARAESLRQDLAEEMKNAPATTDSPQ
jgi:hypothetical protein